MPFPELRLEDLIGQLRVAAEAAGDPNPVVKFADAPDSELFPASFYADDEKVLWVDMVPPEA